MNSQLTSICSPNPTQELLFKISFENYSSIKRNRMDNIPFLVSTTHICENLHDMICHSCKEVIDIAITQLNWIIFLHAAFLFLIHSVSVSVHVYLLSAE